MLRSRNLQALTSWLPVVVGVAAIYFVVGRLTLLMAIPPEYAMAVWPGAGFALAAVLRWGHRAVLGVAIGSLLVEIGLDFGAPHTSGFEQGLLVSASIGLGAALQAVLGAMLIKRWVKSHNTLEQERDIIRFLLIGGPLACLFNASWATTTLVLAGALQLGPDQAFSAMTWWVGDSIGVLLFAPLTLAFIGLPRSAWRSRRRTVVIPLVIGFGVATAFFVRASEWEQQRLNAEFERRANQIAQAVERSVDRYIAVGRSLASFLTSMPDATPTDFETFVRPALATEGRIQALTWVPREPPPDPLGEPGFPVRYIAPLGGNERALGFDIASRPMTRAALRTASDSALTVGTASFRLVQETAEQAGVVFVTPVYASPTTPATVAERRALLRGVANVVLRVDDIMDEAVSSVDRRDLLLTLVDVSAGGTRLYLDRRFPQHQAVPGQRIWTRTFEVAQREWRLEVATTPAYLASERGWQAWAVLVGGLAVVGLLGTLLLILSGRDATRAAAEARYRDLYDNAPDMYASLGVDPMTVLDCNNALAAALGLAKADLIGRPVLDLYPAECRPAAQAALSSVMELGEVRAVELCLLGPGGVPFDVSLSMTAVRDDAGRVVRTRAIWRDIHARKQLERDQTLLLQLGEEMRAFVDSAELLHHVASRVGEHFRLSRCAFLEVDLDAGTFVLRKGFHRDVPPAAGTFPISTWNPEAMADLRNGTIVANTDTARDARTAAIYPRVHGPLRIGAFVSVPLRREGRLTALLTATDSVPRAFCEREIMLLQNIAERSWLVVEQVRMVEALRQSEAEYRTLSRSLEDRVAERTRELAQNEARFRALFRYSPISMWELDCSELRAHFDALRSAGVRDVAAHLRADPAVVRGAARLVRVIAVNDATLAMYGARDEQQIREQASALLVDETYAVLLEALCFLIEGKEPLFSAESVSRTLEGKQNAIHVTMSMLPGFEQSWARVLVSVQDVTIYQEAERHIRASLKEKEVLLKEVHHRVKNNLQVITSLLSLQAHSLDGGAAREMFEESMRRVQTIALVHERLYQASDLARVDFAQYVTSLVAGILATRNASEAITSRIDITDVRLPVDIAIPCGLIVNELVSNAMKHAFPGGRRGSIRVSLGPTEAGELELVVADDGVGLPASVDPRQTSSLGLELVTAFAEQLGGTVEIERAPGTTFRLRFPAGNGA